MTGGDAGSRNSSSKRESTLNRQVSNIEHTERDIDAERKQRSPWAMVGISKSNIDQVLLSAQEPELPKKKSCAASEYEAVQALNKSRGRNPCGILTE
jgi:hypothetical protein